MSTSAERPLVAEGTLRDGVAVRLRALPYDDPVAQDLVERVQLEYVARYGGRDEAVVDPAEFLPPQGLFLAAEADGEPVGSACGGRWVQASPRSSGSRRARFRRRGLAQLIMDALERQRGTGGPPVGGAEHRREQPEALGLYAQLGTGR